MVFVACGLNHKTAPLEVREQFSYLSNHENSLLHRLFESPDINEVAILSTCNRTEFYCDTHRSDAIFSLLFEDPHLDFSKISTHFYLHQDHQAVKHALRVASGLDSMMLGEPQILGQMKQTYFTAKHAGTLGPNLRHLFQYVFQASKRVRNQSGIGHNPISVASAATQLIEQYFAQTTEAIKPQKKLSDLTVFLIGSGDTSSLVAKYLYQKGVRQFMVANRTIDHAKQLATTYAAKIISLVDIPQHLSQADVLVSATTCPLPFISQTMVEQALKERHQAPMFFLDLAVPRDIEANVAQLDGAKLCNIDDLQYLTAKGMDDRQSAALKAEKLVDIELNNYILWHRSLKAKHVICDYRNQMHDLAQLELERALQKLSAGHSQYDVLKDFGQRLVNKLTHRPTLGLKQVALDDRDELLELAHYLLNPTKIQHEEIA